MSMKKNKLSASDCCMQTVESRVMLAAGDVIGRFNGSAQGKPRGTIRELKPVVTQISAFPLFDIGFDTNGYISKTQNTISPSSNTITFTAYEHEDFGGSASTATIGSSFRSDKAPSSRTTLIGIPENTSAFKVLDVRTGYDSDPGKGWGVYGPSSRTMPIESTHVTFTVTIKQRTDIDGNGRLDQRQWTLNGGKALEVDNVGKLFNDNLDSIKIEYQQN